MRVLLWIFFTIVFIVAPRPSHAQQVDPQDPLPQFTQHRHRLLAIAKDIGELEKGMRSRRKPVDLTEVLDDLADHTDAMFLAQAAARGFDICGAVDDLLEVGRYVRAILPYCAGCNPQSDKTAMAQYINRRFSAYADELDAEGIQLANRILGATKRHGIADVAVRLRDELRAVKSLLQETHLP